MNEDKFSPVHEGIIAQAALAVPPLTMALYQGMASAAPQISEGVGLSPCSSRLLKMALYQGMALAVPQIREAVGFSPCLPRGAAATISDFTDVNFSKFLLKRALRSRAALS